MDYRSGACHSHKVHGLVGGAKSHFEKGRPVDEGAYLKPYKKLLVDVTASLTNLDKALGLANDLFKYPRTRRPPRRFGIGRCTIGARADRRA
jgi:hypothetical protein